MKARAFFHNRVVAAFMLLFVLALPAAAQTDQLDALFAR
jgi:hypothetical protein